MKRNTTPRWIAGLTAATSIVASFGTTAAADSNGTPIVTGVGNGDVISMSSLDLGADVVGASANVVEWRLDGAKVARDNAAPFEQTVDISSLSDGEHELFTKAKINGTWHTSKPVYFVIDTSAPEATLGPHGEETNPMDGHGDMGGHGGTGAWLAAADETVEVTDAVSPTDHAVFDFLETPPNGWGRERIGFLLSCSSVTHEQFDPIVSPGGPSAHLHEFFGNTTAAGPNLSTQQLVDSDTNCSDPNDRSSYWSPAVYQDGELLTAKYMRVYYKSPVDVDTPIPLGLRMIAGDAGATGNQGSKVGGWAQYGNPAPYNTYNTDETSMVDAGPDGYLELVVNYPSCWDGVHLDSPDHKSHMAYTLSDYTDYKSVGGCPETHPVRIPQLVTFTKYKTTGGEGLSLASGDWFSYHQDFWNGFHPEQFQNLIDECITAEVNCRNETQSRFTSMGQRMQTIG